MTTLLVVEASTAAGSVALVRNGVVCEEREVAMGVSRDDHLLPAIVDVLRCANTDARSVDGIACGAGPGSFTSLRIAAALCKGFATANATSLYAVPSLLLAAGELYATPGRYVMHSDALRSERFALAVTVAQNGTVVSDGALERIAASEIDQYALSTGRTPIVVAPGAHVAHARAIVKIAAPLNHFGPVSLAAWEPEYGRLAEAQVKWEHDHGRPLPQA